MKKENKVIQGLWVGKSLSLMEQLSIKSFLANGHEYYLYTYGKVKNIPEGTIIKNGEEILPKQMIFKHQIGEGKGSYAGFSELFRLKLLLEKGGIWADLDIVCLKPFDFKEKYIFSSENTPNGKIKSNVGVIKVPRNDFLIEGCYKEAIEKNSKTIRFAEMGPELINFKINKFKLKSFVLPPDAFCPIDYWDFKKVIDPNFYFKIPKESYAIHLWNEKWRREIKNASVIGYIKKFTYGLSSKLRKRSEIYLYFTNLMKKNNRTLLGNLSINEENKFSIKMKFNKNKIYSSKTLYGQLQRKYL